VLIDLNAADAKTLFFDLRNKIGQHNTFSLYEIENEICTYILNPADDKCNIFYIRKEKGRKIDREKRINTPTRIRRYFL